MISTNTPNTPEVIKEFTYKQYCEILEQVQRDIVFKLKLFSLQVGGTIEKDDFPWKLSSKDKQDRMYVKDLSRLMSSLEGS